MANPLNKSLEKRLSEKRKYMERIKQPRIGPLNKIIDFAIPELEKFDINNTSEKGQVNTTRYNGFAILAVDLYASGWFGYSISPALDWFRVIDSDPELMLNEEVKLWMDIIENRFYTIFENSNFYDIESIKLRYAPCMGWATSYMEEDIVSGFPIFKCYHPGKVYIMDDMHGRPSTTLIVDKMAVGDAIERFGENNLSKTLVDMAMTDEYKEWEFCHLVEPNPDSDNRGILNVNMPFRSIWWQSQAGDPRVQENIKIVRMAGYPFNPYTNWRMRNGSTPYGYGLAEAAYIDIMQSQFMTRDLLMASNRAVDPAYNVPIEMQGNVDVRPHGMNYYDDPQKIVRAVVDGIQYPVGAAERDKIEDMINRHFHVDFFTLIANMQGPAMTATQTIELAGEKAAVISMPIMKYNYENLETIFKNLLMIEMQAGRIPGPPAVYGDRMPVVDFIGPLAQSQRKLFQAKGITSSIEMLSPIWDRFPEAVDRVNMDVVTDYILTTNNFPAKAINKDEDVMVVRQGRAQQQQAQMQQEQQVNQAVITEKMAKADKYTGGRLSQQMEEQNA